MLIEARPRFFVHLYRDRCVPFAAIECVRAARVAQPMGSLDAAVSLQDQPDRAGHRRNAAALPSLPVLAKFEFLGRPLRSKRAF